MFNNKVHHSQDFIGNLKNEKILREKGMKRSNSNFNYLVNLNNLNKEKYPVAHILKKNFSTDELKKIKRTTNYYINNMDFIQDMDIFKPLTLQQKIEKEDKKQEEHEERKNK